MPVVGDTDYNKVYVGDDEFNRSYIGNDLWFDFSNAYVSYFGEVLRDVSVRAGSLYGITNRAIFRRSLLNGNPQEVTGPTTTDDYVGIAVSGSTVWLITDGPTVYSTPRVSPGTWTQIAQALPAGVTDPDGLAVSTAGLYTTYNDNSLAAYEFTGSSWGTGVIPNASNVTGVAYDEANSRIYVVETGGIVRWRALTGDTWTALASITSDTPACLDIDSAGSYYYVAVGNEVKRISI